ncbi:hypothetical protein Dtox_2172 [Desulfofarcimen acetoxidans DSM 771]|jgi:hypothetical protein|uniref:Uncharacterized protein n=1 Tax=Desulfofarcimen acetoxidans (strain ATCC 49208 / DSM 771 / KCTC 5769 / VKM B-1644 / 5575) TaxID=485916 RepID=C8VZL6_DESAS|nr:hypothetical protein [Desulfofarcimen acetoxidans]ACV62994.1 hypothetical protein Dtox_2172 [Desulfofarcimen acetoxidans DSM 771]
MANNYRDWVGLIDINIDFFSAFIKSWIAFNSWYRSVYAERTDRVIIDKLKNEDNDFKHYILSLISGTSSESENFRVNIGNLHTALENSAINTQERSRRRERITFTSIATNNPKNSVPWTNHYQNKFKITRTNSMLPAIISREYRDNFTPYSTIPLTAYQFPNIL